VLSGETTVDDAIVPTTVQNLDFLSSGKLRGAVHGLLATRKMHELTLALRERYDYIFFDAPPIIGVSDASLLVREMDGVLLVVQHRKYPKGVSARAKDTVENMGGKIVGVVLNSINVSRDYSSYYYQSYSYSRYVREQERVS
jgi:succinoglycan biosynthesis transport protein ExoP